MQGSENGRVVTIAGYQWRVVCGSQQGQQGSLRQNSMYSKRSNIASGSEIGQTAALYTEISVINAKINCTQIYKSQNIIQKCTRNF